MTCLVKDNVKTKIKLEKNIFKLFKEFVDNKKILQ